MAHEDSPSSIMYAELKALGCKNNAAALILLDTSLTFGDYSLLNRIKSRSLLSRSIVHVAPGDIPLSFFNDFATSAQAILRTIVEQKKPDDSQEFARGLSERLSDSSADAMVEALVAYGKDANAYRNTLCRIQELELSNEMQRALLLMALFITAGCTGDSSLATQIVHDYAEERMGASFRTVESLLDSDEPEAAQSAEGSGGEASLCLLRLVNGKLKGESGIYRLNPDAEGTIIGSIAAHAGAITDVDGDVSRKHARIYRENGRWYIIGLKSTNGTAVISGADKLMRVVEPPRKERSRDYEPEPFEILPSDTICLGSTTRFIVVSIWDE